MSKGISRYWLDHIAAQKASGLSKTKYSRQNDLSVHKYLYWCLKKEKQDRSKNKAEPSFVPVAVSDNDRPIQHYCTIEYPQGIRLHVQSKWNIDRCQQLRWPAFIDLKK